MLQPSEVMNFPIDENKTMDDIKPKKPKWHGTSADTDVFDQNLRRLRPGSAAESEESDDDDNENGAHVAKPQPIVFPSLSPARERAQQSRAMRWENSESWGNSTLPERNDTQHFKFDKTVQNAHAEKWNAKIKSKYVSPEEAHRRRRAEFRKLREAGFHPAALGRINPETRSVAFGSSSLPEPRSATVDVPTSRRRPAVHLPALPKPPPPQPDDLLIVKATYKGALRKFRLPGPVAAFRELDTILTQQFGLDPDALGLGAQRQGKGGVEVRVSGMASFVIKNDKTLQMSVDWIKNAKLAEFKALDATPGVLGLDLYSRRQSAHKNSVSRPGRTMRGRVAIQARGPTEMLL